MKKLLPIFTILFVVIIMAGKSFAQQWSSEQKEILAAEVNLWDAIQSGNTENFSQYIDDHYWDWDYQNSVPQNKTNDLKWLSNFLKGNSIELYTLNPLTIWVQGDYAYIHYYYLELDKNIASGKEDQSEGELD